MLVDTASNGFLSEMVSGVFDFLLCHYAMGIPNLPRDVLIFVIPSVHLSVCLTTFAANFCVNIPLVAIIFQQCLWQFPGCVCEPVLIFS